MNIKREWKSYKKNSKSIVPQGTVGSNSTLSASKISGFAVFCKVFFVLDKNKIILC